MTGFAAETEIVLDTPDRIVEELCADFAGHGAAVKREGGQARATFPFGTAVMSIGGKRLHLRAEATDLTRLCSVKLTLANHLDEFASPGVALVWTGDGLEPGLPPWFREMTVEAVSEVTPRMRRITLSGPDLDYFAKGPGLHGKLMIPPAGIDRPEWPVLGPSGAYVWPAEGRRPTLRSYTIRSIDPDAGVMDVDFVLHADHGPGSRWAVEARPGGIAGFMAPGGGNAGAADWYLLAGDETALPAIARILERLPASATGVALVEVADREEEQQIRHTAGVELRWLHRNGVEAGRSPLLREAVREIIFPCEQERVFVWAAAEFAAAQEIRRYVRRERKLAKDEQLVVAYWRRGRPEGSTR